MLIIMALIFAMPVFAAEDIGLRSSNYFMYYNTYLHKISDTKLEAWFDVAAVGTMDELGANKIKVQRSLDQENWTTMQTYEDSDYQSMMDEDTVRHASCVTYTFTTGYYYRAVVTLYAKKGNGSATSTVVTPTLNLR